MWTDHYWMGGMWMFPTTMFIVVLIIIVALYIRGERRNNNQNYGSDNVKDETALDILKKRYAKGEITKEEFDKIKADL